MEETPGPRSREVMDTSLPVGSAPPGPPCAPCAGPPTDCITDLIKLQAQVCALQTNYLDTIQKYGQLLSKVQAGTLSIHDIASEIDQLQAQINALNSGDCSGLGSAVKADALIACFSGQEKAITAPAAGSFLASFLDPADGKVRWKIVPGPWIPNGQQLITNGGAGGFPVTLTNFPASGTVYGIFEASISNVISGSVSILVTATSQTLAFCRDTSGSANQEYSYSVALLSSSAASFTVVKAAAAAAVANLTLIGYLVSP